MGLDSSLIDRLCTHDQQAFAAFYDETIDYFWRFLASRYYIDDATKDDLIQAYYVKIRRVIDQYDSSYSFETWYWTIFRNHIKDYFKSSSETFDDRLLEPASIEADQEALIQLDFQKQLLDEALTKLDTDSALIVTLRYLEEKEYGEIAQIMDMTQSTVRKRLSRALQKLKKELSTNT